MAFDGITVFAVTQELNKYLLNGRIAKIAQPEPDELLITIKGPEGQKRLYISANASLPLIYLTDDNKVSPMTAPNFCMLLRKHIGSGLIKSITQPGLERVIRIEIEHLNELGDLCRKFLIIEIMGKHSNIIFCDENDRIIDSIKHISALISSVREVLPGRDYFVASTSKQINPLDMTYEEFHTAIHLEALPIKKALYQHLTGLSPVIAEEFCYRCELDSSLPVTALDNATNNHLKSYSDLLYTEITTTMNTIQNEIFNMDIYFNEYEPVEFSCIDLTHFPNLRKERYTSISEMLRIYYLTKNIHTRIRQKSADLRHVVSVALERNKKKYALQKNQLKDTENRDKYKVYGELINAYGYNLAEGAKSLTCLNYYTNEEITIPLKTDLTAMENSQSYFARYTKQKRTHEALTKFVEETADEISYLESVSTSLDIALTEDDLLAIREELIESGYVRKRYSKKKVKFKNEPLHYTNPEGFDFYVGKNNLQNDELTFHFANGGDWWFHSKGAPGSHVILKATGEGEIPDSAFEDAARLAAYYSKLRGSDKVEIDYIEKKHVKKPSGAKPGFVVYYTNYSMVIDSDISHLILV
jgi:predicted ribosome quality control (RQC) complex YloA/Tae2 family protein